MPNRFCFGVKLGLAVLATLLFAIGGRAAAQQEKVLHSFGSGTDGDSPGGALLADSAGNLYGTTAEGGVYDYLAPSAGTAFELSPLPGGAWSEIILHSFGGRGDGSVPGAAMISDSAGNLYGTTAFGGGSVGCVGGAPVYSGGCGVVFQLRPPATKGGAWTYSILYRFQGGNDGSNPAAPLAFDASGNLFGTASTRGGYYSAAGTVFELSPNASGHWTFKTLHVFNGDSVDGNHPGARVVFDSAGNLFSTTCGGGAYQGGTVFELSPQASGRWVEKILYSFNASSTQAVCPSGLTPDSFGNFFGTTVSGGTQDYGTVFELTPSAGGTWTEQTLYDFNGGFSDGSYPQGGVVFDASGNLYGATGYGGANGAGTVFELSPAAGAWTEKLLHSFGSSGDGTYPNGGLINATNGNLLGVTYGGGSDGGVYGSGTVFAVKP